MAEDDDQGSPELRRMRIALAEMLDMWPERPGEALERMKEAYQAFEALPEVERQLLDELFQTMSAEETKPN